MVPIGAPVTEAYDMLSRGIIDGTFLPPDSIRSFNMNKFLNYQTKVPLGLNNAAFFVVMNEAKWNSLSKADQDAIMSVSGENFAREAGRDLGRPGRHREPGIREQWYENHDHKPGDDGRAEEQTRVYRGGLIKTPMRAVSTVVRR